MNKLVVALCALVLVLVGCSSQNIASVAGLEVNNKGEILNLDEYPKYLEFSDNLNVIGNLNSESKVVALTSSTANLVYELGLNLVAAPTSMSLNEEITSKQESGEILNIGSPLEPNFEIIAKADADVVFIADSMPHIENIESINNLVYMPQSTFEDFYVSVAVISEIFSVDSASELLTSYLKEYTSLLSDFTTTTQSVALIQVNGESMNAMNDASFIGSLLRQLDIKNDYSDVANSYELSKEVLITDNPSTIIMYGHGVLDASVLEDDEYKTIDAVKNNRVFVLEDISGSADLNVNMNLAKLIEVLNEN